MTNLARPAVADRFFERNILVHTHLEKTAGTTLVEALAKMLGAAHVHDLRRPGLPRAHAIAPQDFARIRLLTGHEHFGSWHRSLRTRDPKRRRPIYLACVREPYERFVSFLYYVQRNPGHPAHVRLAGLSAGQAVAELIGERGSAARDYLGDYFGAGRYVLRFPRARWNIEHRYVAVVPHMHVARLVECLARALGYPPPSVDAHNVQERYVADRSGREAFVRANVLDYRIYEYVCSRFEHWLDDFGARLERMAA